MKKKIISLFLTGLLLQGAVYAKDPDTVSVRYSKSISKEDLKKHLEILASDEYEGRETGLKGQKMAAAYIENHFRNIGLLGRVNGNGYQQSFPIIIEKPGNTKIAAGQLSFDFLKDFFYLGSYSDQLVDASSIQFLGYGIDNEGYSDYAGVDVKDKIVLILDGEPKDKNGKSYLKGTDAPSWTMDRMKKIKYAQSRGAKAILVVTPDYDTKVAQFKAYIMNPKIRLKKAVADKKASLPSFYVSSRLADHIFQQGKLDIEGLQKRIMKSGKPQSKVISSPLSIDIRSDIQEGTSENVLGFVEGSDLKDELVVVTAHYDHIGKQGDKIFNGADDDGSGTVAVLELAEAFAEAKKAGFGPRRSILFMTVSGEEKGLLGSEWYTDNPIVPLDATVCDLNIDMIGRQDKEHAHTADYIYIIGSDKLSSELHYISEDCNRNYTKLDLDYKYNAPDDPNRFYYRSDHYNFAKNNIPVIFYFNGVHEDYHKETDEVSKINFEKIEKISRLIFHTAWDVANRTERLKVDRTNDFKN